MLFVNDRPDPPCINNLSTEDKNDILKAFAFSTDIKIISENTGMSIDELRQFLEDNKEAISAEMAWNRMKAGC